jgi:hypothetical protein
LVTWTVLTSYADIRYWTSVEGHPPKLHLPGSIPVFRSNNPFSLCALGAISAISSQGYISG